jgi:hypothetical protein
MIANWPINTIVSKGMFTFDRMGKFPINNTAIAAQELCDAGHVRVAISDVDYHLDAGRQEISMRAATRLWSMSTPIQSRISHTF